MVKAYFWSSTALTNTENTKALMDVYIDKCEKVFAVICLKAVVDTAKS